MLTIRNAIRNIEKIYHIYVVVYRAESILLKNCSRKFKLEVFLNCIYIISFDFITQQCKYDERCYHVILEFVLYMLLL